MKMLFFAASILFAVSCTTGQQNEWQEPGFTYAKVSCEQGDMIFKLYNDTPKHRDNFVKLAKEGYYDGLLFHRVIKDFMIQGGDPDSKGAAPEARLGQGGPGYTIPAEFMGHIHKKGALAAARQGDNVNPEKASSGSQFYIVQGKKYSMEEIVRMESDMGMKVTMSKVQAHIAKEENKSIMDEIQAMQVSGDNAGLQALQEKLVAQFTEESGEFKFSDEVKTAYTELGGTPFLDDEYTVFGEIVEGLEIVDKIAGIGVAPGSNRPTTDMTFTVTIVE